MTSKKVTSARVAEGTLTTKLYHIEHRGDKGRMEESASVAWRGEKQQSEMDFEPGDVSLLPPGHDAWVVGDEPFVAIDIQGMTHYAEPPKKA